MKSIDIFELDDIFFKYQRLTSLISILQTVVVESVEVTGVPADSLSNALYEVELGMDEANARLEKWLQAVHEASRGWRGTDKGKGGAV